MKKNTCQKLSYTQKNARFAEETPGAHTGERSIVMRVDKKITGKTKNSQAGKRESVKNFSIGEKQFELFQRYANQLIAELGLFDWDIHYFLGNFEERSYAFVLMKCNGKVAGIHVVKNWKEEVTKELIKRVAIHEVYELLLCDIRQLCMDLLDGKMVSEDIIERTFHNVVRRLENRDMRRG